MPPPAELLIPRENNLRKILAKRWPKKIKRAGPSHKPHPKATCPHPTRPLRPPGRRARDDYAQVALKMQPKLKYFFDLQRAPIHPSFRIIFYDGSYHFPCGKTDSMLCSKTIT